VATSTEVYRGDYLVLAVGSQPNFFNTPGADQHTFPLYSLDDAQRLRSRILQVFEDADREPTLITEGALNFVIVGAGATGVEIAGAIAELLHGTMTTEYPDRQSVPCLSRRSRAYGATLSRTGHDYAEVLQQVGVQLRLQTGVKNYPATRLSPMATIKTRVVIWAGGLKAAQLAGSAGLPQGRGDRIDVLPDLTARVHLASTFSATSPISPTLPAPARSTTRIGSATGRTVGSRTSSPTLQVDRAPFEYRDKGHHGYDHTGAALPKSARNASNCTAQWRLMRGGACMSPC
jgi:NADH dehydrogenase